MEWRTWFILMSCWAIPSIVVFSIYPELPTLIAVVLLWFFIVMMCPRLGRSQLARLLMLELEGSLRDLRAGGAPDAKLLSQLTRVFPREPLFRELRQYPLGKVPPELISALEKHVSTVGRGVERRGRIWWSILTTAFIVLGVARILVGLGKMYFGHPR